MIKKIIIISMSVSAIIHVIQINNYAFHHYINPVNHKKIEKFNNTYKKRIKKKFKPQYEKIILLVIDGALKKYLYDDNISRNITERWKLKGIRFKNARCMLPSVSAPNYMSILSGAPVYLHGVINNHRRYKKHQNAEIIFPYLLEKKITSAVIGFSWYRDILAERALYIPAECCEKEDTEGITETIIRMIDTDTLPAFTLAHFLAPDNAAHKYGSTVNWNYINAIKKFDKQVGRLFKIIDKKHRKTLLIILADHGMNIDGNHGGTDKNTRNIPFYIFSNNLKGGQAIDRKIYNLSIAPTISALLGISIPAMSSGRLIYEVIDTDRIKDYLVETIMKKQNLINTLENDNSNILSNVKMEQKALTGLDSRLTEKIINFPEVSKNKILFFQKILSAVLLIILVLIILFKNDNDIFLLFLINGSIMALIGLSMQVINSAHRFYIFKSTYTIILFLICFFCIKFIFNKKLLGKLGNGNYILELLAILLPLSIIMSGFFVPFYSTIPDENIFAFKFYQISFFHPIFFTALIFLFSKFKKKLYFKNNLLIQNGRPKSAKKSP